MKIQRSVKVHQTPRVKQIYGLFDVANTGESAVEWDVNIQLPQQWNIGVIVGASGSGKSTVARELFGEAVFTGFEWDEHKSILDGFPSNASIQDITELLSSVGFSSPPYWLRPYQVLSTGQKFRVDMARAIAETNNQLLVMDEYTSVVDRTVAQVSSAAIQKVIRRRSLQFVAVTCHYDVLEWLEPDWVYDVSLNQFTTGRLLQRPKIEINIRRVHHSLWSMFRHHHYLDTHLNTAAQCYAAFLNERPVAFSAVLHFPHPRVKNIKREHRTVVLPDFQGVGIGNQLSSFVGSIYSGAGFQYRSTTTHPAFMRSRAKSKDWRMDKKPQFNSAGHVGTRNQQLAKTYATDRLTAAFVYVGAKMQRAKALQFMNEKL